MQSATLAALEAHRGVRDEDLDKLAVTGLGIEERTPSAVVVRSAVEDVRHLAGEARAGIQLTGGGAATAAEWLMGVVDMALDSNEDVNSSLDESSRGSDAQEKRGTPEAVASGGP